MGGTGQGNSASTKYSATELSQEIFKVWGNKELTIGQELEFKFLLQEFDDYSAKALESLEKAKRLLEEI